MVAWKHRCKRCLVKFASNIKLHNYIQEYYTRKETSSSKWSLSIITSIDTPSALSTKSSFTLFVITSIETISTKRPYAPSTSSPTPSSIWAKIVSKLALQESRTLILSYQKPYSKTIKLHLTIDDLFRMFSIKKQSYQKKIITYFKLVGND